MSITENERQTKQVKGFELSNTLKQGFSTFFGSRHPSLVLNIFGGTSNWLIRYKDQLIITIGGTPGPSS